MRTLFLAGFLVALGPGLVRAQATPSQTPTRVIVPAPAQAPAGAPAQAAPAPAAPPAAAPPPAAPAQGGLAPNAPAPEAAPAAASTDGAVTPPPATQLPPPGYAYETAPEGGAYPSFDPARRSQIYGELNVVDDRLYELQKERGRVSLGGPIAMMAAGYGVGLVSALVALAGFATAEAIEHEDWWDEEDADWNDDGKINGRDERAARNTARVFTGIAAVGLGVGVGGTVLLTKRLAERRMHAPEIHDLKERRRDLRRELRYGANVAPDYAALTVSGRF